MNKQIMKGKWHQMSGKLKQRWGWLTSDDLVRIKGSGEEIYGILQKRYGYTKDEVRQSVREFLKSATLRQFKSFALRNKRRVSESVKANPFKAIVVALSTGVALGCLVKIRK